MPRIPSITNEQILNAAREVFLERGISASTLEIARRAGVSEGTLFKRFSTKVKLFLASMGMPGIPEWVESMESYVGREDVKEALVELSLQIIQSLQERLPRMMMMQTQGISPMQLAAALPEPPAIKGLKSMVAYIEKEQQMGRIRPCNSNIAARTLLGSLMHYVLLEQLGLPPQMEIEPSDYVEELIEFFWESISPT